jgi:hypothetical protein
MGVLLPVFQVEETLHCHDMADLGRVRISGNNEGGDIPLNVGW